MSAKLVLTIFVHAADESIKKANVRLNGDSFMSEARVALTTAAHMVGKGEVFGSIFVHTRRDFPVWEVNYAGDGTLSASDLLRMVEV